MARGGAENIKPYLQRLYAIRIATLQAAGQQFVDGYKDGVEKARADAVIDNLAESFWDKSRKSNDETETKGPLTDADAVPFKQRSDRKSQVRMQQHDSMV